MRANVGLHLNLTDIEVVSTLVEATRHLEQMNIHLVKFMMIKGEFGA